MKRRSNALYDASDGLAVYESKVDELADTFIESELNGKTDDVKNSFMRMLFFVNENMGDLPTEDTNLLDTAFNNYVRLCMRWNVLPSIFGFGILAGIDNGTISAWISGEIRRETHQQIATRWKNICAGFVMDKLQNSSGSNVNLIFTAKAAYGYVEVPAPQIVQTDKVALGADQLPKLANFQAVERRI